jgi:hypothetical protein
MTKFVYVTWAPNPTAYNWAFLHVSELPALIRGLSLFLGQA